MTIRKKIVVTKLDAAKSQLRTAIRLWFEDGDPVSIHTLAYAAYEIVHVVSKKRNRTRLLIFDSDTVKDEFRSQMNVLLKKAPNFFKHADRDDPDSSVELHSDMSVVFMMGAMGGLRSIKESASQEELALFYWLCFHRPEWIKPNTQDLLKDNLGVEGIAHIKSLAKGEFLKAFDVALKNHRGTVRFLPQGKPPRIREYPRS